MATVTAATPIRAAGGVVWRGDPVEVCVVHRPRLDDWSLPKGKRTASEHPLLAAVREVHEETAIRAAPQLRLPSAHYRTDGQPKVVDFWSMRAIAEEPFAGGDEVDDLRWLPPPAAADLVSYPHDRAVLLAFAALPPVTGVIALIRHARAGQRAEWDGPDRLRPLDPVGIEQAQALAALLVVLRPRRLVSATPVRCRQTIEPLAAALGLPIETDGAFDEEVAGAAPGSDVAAGRLRDLAGAAESTVVCGQGKAMPEILAAMTADAPHGYHTPKGHGWLLAFAGDACVGADRISIG